MLPEVATTPTAKRLSYPAAIIPGIMMDPIATTVAGEDPEMAAKNMQATTVAMASPPGIQPTAALAKSTSRWDTPPVVRKCAERMKKGIARSVVCSMVSNSFWAMIIGESSVASKVNSRLDSPRLIAIGTPMSNRNSSPRNRNSASIRCLPPVSAHPPLHWHECAVSCP